MTPGHMTDVILATMMTAEVVAADVTTTTMVAVGTTTGQEIMTGREIMTGPEIMIGPEIMTGQEIMTETVTAVVMVEIGMMTGGTKGRQDLTGYY